MTKNKFDKISALFLCADILDYPGDDYIQKLNEFELISGQSLQNHNFKLDDIESNYLRVFSIQSTALKCVPYASWWIDGKMSGIALSKIVDFYNKCGYAIDADLIKRPADHISLMITFTAILAEEKRFKEIKEFTKFLTWIDDFANSLGQNANFKAYGDAVNMSLEIINSFKEEI